MNDPVLYNKYNKLPHRDVKELLEEYGHKMKWKTFGDKSLDIGCADGGVTNEILKKYIPSNYSKLVGSDISENMVLYANKHHGDEKTYFVIHDIQSDVPDEMIEGFDHVFSFYALHWVPKQRAAIDNIYSMLADGGDCFLMLIAYTPIFSVYRLMAQKLQWAPWLAGAEQFISPYQDSLVPEKEFRFIMEEAGFKNVDVVCQHKSCMYEGQDCINYMKGLVAAVSPFSIPAELKDEYLEDYIQTAVTHKLMKYVTNDNGEIVGFTYDYSLIVAYACK